MDSQFLFVLYWSCILMCYMFCCTNNGSWLVKRFRWSSPNRADSVWKAIKPEAAKTSYHETSPEVIWTMGSRNTLREHIFRDNSWGMCSRLWEFHDGSGCTHIAEVLDRPRIDWYECWACTQYKPVSLCQARQDSDWSPNQPVAEEDSGIMHTWQTLTLNDQDLHVSCVEVLIIACLCVKM